MRITNSITTIIETISHSLGKLLLDNLLTHLYKKHLQVEFNLINILNAKKSHEIFSDCSANRLSPLAMPPNKLKTAIQTLQKELNAQNFSLAIPLTHIFDYYSNPLSAW